MSDMFQSWDSDADPDSIEDLISQYESSLAEATPLKLQEDAYSKISMYYLMLGITEDALEACEIGLKFYPFSVRLMLDSAFALLKSEQYDDALEHLDRVETFAPYNVEMVLYKSMAWDSQGWSSKALTFLDEKLPLVDEPWEIQLQKGYILRDLGKNPEALECLWLGLNHEPERPEAIWSILVCAEQSELLEDAVFQLESLADDQPLNRHLWLGIGSGYHKLGLYEKAIENYENALALDQEFEEAWLQRGHSLMNIKQFDEAFDSYSRAAVSLPEDAEINIYLAAALEHQKILDKAITYYKKAIELDPLLADGYYGVGMCLLALKSYPEAVYFFNEALSFDADNELYWLGLAQAEFKIGHIQAATAAFEKTAELDATLVELWLDWSYLYFEEENYDRAIELIHLGIEEMPDEAELWFRSSAYHMKAGLYTQALGFLENGLILDFDKHETLFEFFTDLETQKALYKLIDQYRDKLKK